MMSGTAGSLVASLIRRLVSSYTHKDGSSRGWASVTATELPLEGDLPVAKINLLLAVDNLINSEVGLVSIEIVHSLAEIRSVLEENEGDVIKGDE
jgi:hypothetical protein